MPETLSLSSDHQLNERRAIMGDVSRTRWSRIPEVRISFDNALQPDAVEILNWKDSTRYAVGASCVLNEHWTWRTGIAYDQSPMPGLRIEPCASQTMIDPGWRWVPPIRVVHTCPLTWARRICSSPTRRSITPVHSATPWSVRSKTAWIS
ncbi:MAG: OmpP1/FadL family transporter [Sulfuricaulis sp.]